MGRFVSAKRKQEIDNLPFVLINIHQVREEKESEVFFSNIAKFFSIIAEHMKRMLKTLDRNCVRYSRVCVCVCKCAQIKCFNGNQRNKCIFCVTMKNNEYISSTRHSSNENKECENELKRAQYI